MWIACCIYVASRRRYSTFFIKSIKASLNRTFLVHFQSRQNKIDWKVVLLFLLSSFFQRLWKNYVSVFVFSYFFVFMFFSRCFSEIFKKPLIIVTIYLFIYLFIYSFIYYENSNSKEQLVVFNISYYRDYQPTTNWALIAMP